jgi:long-chain acyl-CoA synthetase
MPDPLALLPLALAAGGGRVDQYEAQQLVAAGLTLLQRSVRLVRALSGRRGAILLPTSPAFVTALAACEGRGAVLVNPLAAPPEIAAQLDDAGVGAVFTTSALAPRVPPGTALVLLDGAPRSARVAIDGTSADVDLGSHFPLALEGDPETPAQEEEAVIVYTSAMAGRPLGAILTHRNLLANGRSCLGAAGNSADDHVLALLPFSHLFGLTVTGTAPLLAGARVATVERFNPVRAVELIEGLGITEIVGVPAVFMAMLGVLERRGGRLTDAALRACICGGAVLPAEVQERWYDATGVELRQGYGLTEAGPVCVFNRIDQPNRRGTLGVPFPGVEVRIDDPVSGAPLARGKVGEIRVRGDNVSPGYVSSGELGLARHGGWLATGDLGAMNEDGTVTFAGVLKPMFTRNGFNIYPRELERAVGELPGIRAVRVRAVPDPLRENDIALAVEGDVTEDEVRRWCEARLSAYKQPSEIKVTRPAAAAR